MNGLNSDICYDILSLLQNNVCPVENVCNICGASHYTQNCPDYTLGEHVRDTPLQNMSRSSVPSGLHIIETDEGTCVVTSQKFAKGSRFGPLLAEKSFFSVHNAKFPLVIFGNPLFSINDPELEELFKERNIYLDTTNENNCNWMIHVAPAKYSNEQNLICFQLHNQIYYTAIQDIDVGDILKVWYAPKYAAKMKVKLLQSSPYEIVNNVLRQVSMGTLDSLVEDSLSQQIINSFDNQNINSKEVSLPPINSLMRTPSLTFYQNNNYLFQDLYSNNFNDCEIGNKYYDTTELNISLTAEDDLNGLPLNTDLINFQFDSNIYEGDSDDPYSDGKSKLYHPTISTDYILNHSTPKKKKHFNEKFMYNPRLKPAVYSCKLCNKTYVAICNLNKHHLHVHNLHLCNLCMKTFKSMELLKVHVCPNQTFDSECSKCPICYKVLANPWSLARHIKCTHKGYTISVKKKEIILEEIDPTSGNSMHEGTTQQLILNEVGTENETNDSKDDNQNMDIHIYEPYTDGSFNHVQNSPNVMIQSSPLIDIGTFNLSQHRNNNDSLSSNDYLLNDKISIKLENVSDDDVVNLPPLVQIQQPKVLPESFYLNGTGNGKASPVKAAIARALVSKLTKKSNKNKNNTTDGLNSFEITNNGNDSVGKKSLLKKIKETNRTHKCDECGKMYAKRDGLQKHKLTHENRSYYCPFCSHSPVKSNDSLRRHFRLNHGDMQEQWAVKGFVNSCIVKIESNDTTDSNNVLLSSVQKENENWSPKIIFENDNQDNHHISNHQQTKDDNIKIKKNLKRLQNNNNVPYFKISNFNGNQPQQLILQQHEQICDLKCAKNSNLINNISNSDNENSSVQNMLFDINGNSDNILINNHVTDDELEKSIMSIQSTTFD